MWYMHAYDIVHNIRVHNIIIIYFLQADLLFKKEEKEKSEATAKTLELGIHFFTFLRNIVRKKLPLSVINWHITLIILL